MKILKANIGWITIPMLLFFLFPCDSFTQVTPKNLFEEHSDIGKVTYPGSVQFNPLTQEFIMSGSGKNIWFSNDAFFYNWRKIKGDFLLRTRVSFLDKGVNPHRKVGWMIRKSTDSDAPHVSAVVHGDGLASLQYRKNKGEVTMEIKSDIRGPDMIQLERTGNLFIMSVARFGQPFKTLKVSEINLGDQVLAGLFICSHDEDVTEKAVFKNVRIVIPAGPNLKPYEEYLASNMEILRVREGIRKIVYQSPTSIQAPNWTRDGEYLIYNKQGLIYRFDIEKKDVSELPTGFAKSNNNDHVISFDGKMLGISNHNSAHQNHSMVYVLPLEGGIPFQVTDKGPSYLHGWSPDGNIVVYTGARNNEYDIYKKDIHSNEPEIRLTTAKGLDDGPEYTPDGKYIYFNSNRTGTMQIYRMKPDGSQQEQLSFDAYNDWFPHLSPDGKWMVFLSFPKEVDSGDHPFYKHVYLRIMPSKGGNPKVIAYVYGGQGTINVPSWSPDSKHFAFVSYMQD